MLINKIDVSVVIPVKNEEDVIEMCLDRLSRFREVVVVDSSSSDATVELVGNYNVPVVNFCWNGKYPKKRNWILKNYNFLCKWVLFLDADEILNEKVIQEIQIAVSSNQYEAFWLSYNNYFLGKQLKFGVPQRKLALFRIGAGFYEKIDEDSWSNFDMEIHEHPIISGRIGSIQSPIEHREDHSLQKFLEKHIEYAKWECGRVALLKRTDVEAEKKNLTTRQNFKYRYIDRWWFPYLYFLFTYFIRLGFLDKGAGFFYAFYKMWYFNTVGILIRNSRDNKKI